MNNAIVRGAIRLGRVARPGWAQTQHWQRCPHRFSASPDARRFGSDSEIARITDASRTEALAIAQGGFSLHSAPFWDWGTLLQVAPRGQRRPCCVRE